MRDGPDEAPVPKVTPWVLRVADDLCARRLRADYECLPGTPDRVNRSRLRDALLEAVRTWHATGTRPEPVSPLETEEHRVLDHALDWYERLFERAVGSVETPLDEPTFLPRRGVRLGGWVDLLVEHDDGTQELRFLALGGREAPDDLLDLEPVRLAVLRLAADEQLRDGDLLVTRTDLLAGEHAERSVRVPDDLGALGAWLDARLAVVRERAADGTATAGRDCTTCRHLPRCPEHSVLGAMSPKRDDFRPGVLSVTPTGLDRWRRCRREWRNQILNVPVSDAAGFAAHGSRLHDLLRLVHTQGTCADEAFVDDVLTSHAVDARSEHEIRRHAARCPTGATSVGHEVEWARAFGKPPVFVASARLDAVWEHSGVLEIRDYKTGGMPDHRVGDDRRAWVQAWVAAPVARARGLGLRVRYEYLSLDVADDPEPWEPDDDDLAAVQDALMSEVSDMRAEQDWHGVADATICRTCSYRSICPDSASPGEPVWPVVDDELEPLTSGV